MGLAQLISASSTRQARGELRSAVIASDLHNNLLALPALDRAVGSRPLFFVGDLTSSGSPFEFNLVRRVVRIGHPFVFVSGNHDSDALVRRMALAGGIVLTQRGRLRADGGYGPVVVRVRGLRVAGYADPFERKASERFKGTNEPTPDAAQREAFRDWLRPLLGHVDVVMVHEPQLAARRRRRAAPDPAEPAARPAHGSHARGELPHVHELHRDQRRHGGRRRHRATSRRTSRSGWRCSPTRARTASSRRPRISWRSTPTADRRGRSASGSATDSYTELTLL